MVCSAHLPLFIVVHTEEGPHTQFQLLLIMGRLGKVIFVAAEKVPNNHQPPWYYSQQLHGVRFIEVVPLFRSTVRSNNDCVY